MSDPIETVRRRHEDALMGLPNVRGVAIGERRGRPVIKVYVTAKVASASLRQEELVPSALEGHEVDVEEIGEAEAL